jgi:hypothetical protein
LGGILVAPRKKKKKKQDTQDELLIKQDDHKTKTKQNMKRAEEGVWKRDVACLSLSRRWMLILCCTAEIHALQKPVRKMN